MLPKPNEAEIKIWNQFVEFSNSRPNEDNLIWKIKQFLSEPIHHNTVLKFGLRQTTTQIIPSLQILKQLEPESLTPFLRELVALVAFSQRHINAAAELILKMPRDWVIANIEKEANEVLTENDYYEYQQIMSLYIDLDQDLASRFAHRTLTNPDKGVREIGEEYLGL